MMYKMQVKSNSGKWLDVRPSGNSEPYSYNSEEKAKEILELCYGGEECRVVKHERDINSWPLDGHDGIVQNYYGKIDTWVECTEVSYTQLLCSVPPAKSYGGAFLLGECHTIDEEGRYIYACFARVNGRFFGKLMWINDFNWYNIISQINEQYFKE